MFERTCIQHQASVDEEARTPVLTFKNYADVEANFGSIVLCTEIVAAYDRHAFEEWGI